MKLNTNRYSFLNVLVIELLKRLLNNVELKEPINDAQVLPPSKAAQFEKKGLLLQFINIVYIALRHIENVSVKFLKAYLPFTKASLFI